MSGILFLTESFHPVLGGGERHIRSLGAQLATSGLPCTVVTRRSEANWPAEELLDGVRVMRVGPSGPGRLGKYLMVPAALRALRDLRSRYGLIVVRGTRVLGLPGLLAGRALGKAVVLQAELNGEMSGELYSWGAPWSGGAAGRALRCAVALRNLWLRDADAFVAMSEQIRREFLAAGVAPRKVSLIPHGVDTQRFRPATRAEREALRHRLGLPAGLVVVYTGRLLRGKGLETLVEAFADLAGRAPGAHLLLVGSGAGQTLSVEQTLRRQVDERGLAGRVIFTGRVDDVEDYLRASDVFVFPSLFEALGISLVEAASCGLPCVGSRTGGIVDVIEDGRSGRLVQPGDPGALAEALWETAEDGAHRDELGRRGRARVLTAFDARDSLDRYRALFGELLTRRSPCPRPGRAPRAGAGSPPSPASRA